MVDDRALSHVLGFAIVFGIVVASIGLVYMDAIPDLTEWRDNTDVKNTERAFSILRSNINDISQGGAPSRGTEIKLRQAELRVGEDESTWINVTLSCPNCTFNNTIDPIVYVKENQRIAYENGAVFRGTGDEWVMTEEPTWVITNRTTIIPVILTKGSGTTSVGGDDIFLARALRFDSNLHTETDIENVTITIKSPRAEAWCGYMSEFEDVGVSTDPSDCSSVTDRVSLEIQDRDRVVYAGKHIRIILS